MEFIFDGKKIEAKPLGKCVCGQDIFYTMEPPSVLHGLPYCRPFMDLEIDQFLRYVRRHRGITEN